MAQDYTDDCFASDHVVQTDMANIEKNFAALKSAFSGATAPSNLVAGMWWFDTTSNILKLRNEANNAWQSVWNFASNKPVIANLSNEITGAMIAAAIKDPAVGTAGLRTLGTGAQQAMPGNQPMIPPVDSVTLAKMQHGSIMLSFHERNNASEHDSLSDAYEAYDNDGKFKIYIPADATTIRMASRQKKLGATASGYARFGVGGNYSNDSVTTSDSYEWLTGAVLDVSALSGWHDMEIQLKKSGADAHSYLQGFSFIWE